MLPRRIIALTPDKSFGKSLAVALKAAGGTVDVHGTLDELGADDVEIRVALVVIHLDGDLAGEAPRLLKRLGGETPVIAILPRSNLAAVVDIMKSSDRVAGMLVAEVFDGRQLSAMATRVLIGDIFGLEKLVLWGTQIHSFLVGDYQEKSLCIARVSELAEHMGVRRKYREAIEQCVDEMLMNALYDAPVDDQGRQIFAEIPTKTRISLRVEQKVVVQFACDGTQFLVAVRDAFGTLERETVLRYLHKCLHSEQQIDRKIGGAGLGLYLMTSSSTQVLFNVLPGVATEVVCTFELAREMPKLALECFGFFSEQIDAGGRLAAGPSRRLPSGLGHPVERRAATAPPARPRGVVLALGLAIVATLALIAVVAWPRLFSATRTELLVKTTPSGATIEVEGRHAGITTDGTLRVRDLQVGRTYPIVARLDGHAANQVVFQPKASDNELALQLAALPATVFIDSHPRGAQIQIVGERGPETLGTTPFSTTKLAPGRKLEVTFEKVGYQDARVEIDVPKPGKEARLVQPLVLAQNVARVQLDSDPPGAQVLLNGQLLAGVTTPTEVIVEGGKPAQLTLTLPGKVPAVIPEFTPASGEAGIAKRGKLVDGITLRVSANLEGKASVLVAQKGGAVQVQHCQELPLPLECLVAPGNYVVQLAMPQAARIDRKVSVEAAPVELKLELGYVVAPPGTMLQLAGGPRLSKLVMETGPRRVTIIEDAGPRSVMVTVKPGATVVAN